MGGSWHLEEIFFYFYIEKRCQTGVTRVQWTGVASEPIGDDLCPKNMVSDYIFHSRKCSLTPFFAGASSEQVARQLHQMRRDLGVQYKDLTPAPELEVIYARNLKTYGDKLGPTIDWLRAKGKSWEQIIESSSRPGGKDLGL
jgi:hypothetical protein